jgi:hypothetical protein
VNFRKPQKRSRRPHLTHLLALTAFAAVLIPALPASASHKNPRIVISAQTARWGYRDDCRPQLSLAQREYERGRQAGTRDGFDAGYRDGVRGSSFCDRLDRDVLCHASRYFRDGYMEAYSCAYREGFEEGREDRRGCHSSHSWLRRW